jgi:hypothetical protein
MSTTPNLYRIFAALTALSLCTGCTVEAEDGASESVDTLSSPSVTTNGLSTNGLSTNGLSTNGLSTNGLSTNGTNADLIYFAFDTDTATNFKKNGVPVKNVWLSDGVIYAKLQNNKIIKGSDLVGLQVSGKLNDGWPVTLRIDGVEKFESLAKSDLYRLHVAGRPLGARMRQAKRDPHQVDPGAWHLELRAGNPRGRLEDQGLGPDHVRLPGLRAL